MPEGSMTVLSDDPRSDLLRLAVAQSQLLFLSFQQILETTYPFGYDDHGNLFFFLCQHALTVWESLVCHLSTWALCDLTHKM